MATRQPITRICSPGVVDRVYLQSRHGRTCEIWLRTSHYSMRGPLHDARRGHHRQHGRSGEARQRNFYDIDLRDKEWVKITNRKLLLEVLYLPGEGGPGRGHRAAPSHAPRQGRSFVILLSVFRALISDT